MYCLKILHAKRCRFKPEDDDNSRGHWAQHRDRGILQVEDVAGETHPEELVAGDR
jgi:hypothetical protein